jgi:hypothetical protein
MRKKRLYILGDSFAANLFKGPWVNKDSDVYKFKEYFKNKHNVNVRWWTDYIEMWSDYEIHNFGYAGCSSEDIILQFGNIDDYHDGDRIVVHLTSPLRFKLHHNVNVATVNPDYLEKLKLPADKIEFLVDMLEARKTTWFGEDGEKQRKFISYLHKIHHNFKPIIFSMFPENVLLMKNKNYFTNVAELLSPESFIYVESESKFNDGHFGYVGNLRMALSILSHIFYGDDFADEEKLKIRNYFPNNGGYNLENLSIYQDYIINHIKPNKLL